MFRITLRFHGGNERPVDGYHADLSSAMALALKLADHEGRPYVHGDEPRPSWVRIWRHDELQIAITVVAGGIDPKEDSQREALGIK